MLACSAAPLSLAVLPADSVYLLFSSSLLFATLNKTPLVMKPVKDKLGSTSVGIL